MTPARLQVLRFYLAWDDRKSLYGELRPFVMHYYLSDDTMEVLEVRLVESNSLRMPTSLALTPHCEPRRLCARRGTHAT